MSEDRTDEDWQRYARAVIAAMREVLEEADDRSGELLLETADFWLSLGLLAGLERPDEAQKLLGILEGSADERIELLADADAFLDEAVR